MKKEICLAPTILDKFMMSGETFALLDSRIYTIERNTPSANGNAWKYLKEQYPLFESDELSLFQRELFKDNEDDLKEYMSWVIDFKLIRRLKELSSQVSKKINYYGSMKEQSLDRFIQDVFKIYNYQREKKKEVVIEDPKIDTAINSYPALDDLHNIETRIYDLIPRPGIVTIAGTCYELISSKARRNGTLTFKGTDYSLKPLMPLQKLADEYRLRLRADVEQVALQHGKKFKNQILLLYKKEKEIDANISKKKVKKTRKKVGNIRYEPRGNNEYLFYAEIEPYLLEKDGKYYAFNEEGKEGSKRVRVGTTLDITDRYVTIKNEPTLRDMPYNHPFVYPSGRICFAGAERWSYLNVKFLHKYSIKDKGLARRVALMLWEATGNITTGYIGNTLTPVHSISNYTPIALNEDDAKDYAKKHGISEERIFKN